MKKFSILCLLAFMALCGVTSCKNDPTEFNNIPTLHLQEPTDLLRTSVTLHGSILTSYPQHIEEYGFLFSSSIDFSSSDTQRLPIEAESLADISVNLSNLEIGETYFYLLYATGADELQSDVHSITMPMRSGATLSEVEVLDLYTPTLKARITDDGGSTITSVGFCWSTSPNPTIFTGEHEFATYDEESQSFTADLTKLKGHEDYYIRAFAESDITGAGNMSISYGKVVELSLKHKVIIEAVEKTATTLTFRLIPFNCEQVKWLVTTESDVTAERVFAEGTAADADNISEMTAENLEPKTTYRVYAVAEAERELVLAATLEMTTTVHKTWCIYYTSSKRNIIEPYDATVFGANIVSNTYNIVSNTYENGQGVITFDGPVTSIGEYAFYKCAGLTSVTIPDSVTSIGSSAFRNCTGLTSVSIPDSVTSIGSSAFYYCTGLTSVTIPDSVTSISSSAFSDCSGLTSVTIPDSVTSIGDYAFRGCTGLTSVTIPDSVTEIGWYAFSGCTGLNSVTIPDSVTSIEVGAFRNCTGLTSITIPDSVTSIGEGAFSGCTGLTSVTIPDSVTKIGWNAFEGCTGLTSVYCKPTTPPTGGSKMFNENASDRKIYVPNASVDAYKSAQYWSDYASSIVGYDF